MLKPSEQTPLTALKLAHALAEHLPEGVANIIAGRGATVGNRLINHPQVAIFGVYRIAERPVVRDGAVVVRRTGNVSVTFDHRVIDGKRAADFGLAVIARLQR